jgi:hypothetical protein
MCLTANQKILNMTRLKFILLIFLYGFQLVTFGQNNNSIETSPLARFHHPDYESFREYIQRNAFFLPEAFDNTGVLLAGIVLDINGNINQVFSFNSLYPTIDNSILTLFETTKGLWKAIADSTTNKKSQIIIVPIVFSLKGTEYKIDTSNFKLPVQDEIELTALIAGQQASSIDYQKTESLLKKYDKLMSKGDYSDAYDIMIELLKREPFNTDFYSRLIKLASLQGDNEGACQNLKFIQTYFVNQPDSEIIRDLNCE